MIEFKEFPKIPRLNRDMVITEKIDGTNAAVIVLPVNAVEDAHSAGADELAADGAGIVVNTDLTGEFWEPVVVAAQSRKRIIKPGKQTDNAGFAALVRTNAAALAATLGEGYHYGEWWGAQNARKALQPGEQKLSLFNTHRWTDADLSAVPGLDVVPVLYDGPFDQRIIEEVVDHLRVDGSVAHPEVPAEGVVVFMRSSGENYKVLCHGDELPKGVTTRMERDIDGNLSIPKKES